MSLIGECAALEFLPIDLLGRAKGPPIVRCTAYDPGKIVLEYVVGWVNESLTVTLMVVATLWIGNPIARERFLYVFRTTAARMFAPQG